VIFLLKRVISSIVLIAIGAYVVFADSFLLYFGVVVLLTGGIMYELLKAAKVEFNTLLPFASLIGAVAFLIYRASEFGWWKNISWPVIVGCVFAVFIDYIVHHEKFKFETVFYALAVMFLVPFSLSHIILIRWEMDSSILMYDSFIPNFSATYKLPIFLITALCGAWLADTGAYFIGTFLGKHKLCPKISPKKTVEGLVGGAVFTGISFVIIERIFIRDSFDSYIFFLLGVGCCLVGLLGDLTASLIKRQTGIKDFGKIMPGHGGLMDRFDSVLFVLPFFYYVLKLLKVLEL
jgi:phosphatidate cytidylyltransferase